MAKRYLKQSTHFENDNTGCLSGLISIFDFRQGQHRQKLLSDRKTGSGGHLGTGNSRKLDLTSKHDGKIKIEDINKEVRNKEEVSSGKASVKTLINEEMSRTHDPEIQRNTIEQLKSEFGLEIHSKRKNKKKSMKNNVASNQHADALRSTSKFDFGQDDFDLNAFAVEFCSENTHNGGQADYPQLENCGHIKVSELDEAEFHISQKYFTLQKELRNLVKLFVSQKLVHPKQFTCNGPVQFREFIDALEIVSSNKELFLKLIKEPNSVLLKHIQDTQDAHVESEILKETSSSDQLRDSVSSELLQKQSQHNFFSTKHKSRRSNSGISQDMNNIVVLKPIPGGVQNASGTLSLSPSLQSHNKSEYQEGERAKSFFSLKDIKRRLRRVIGEQTSRSAEQSSQPPAISKKREQKSNLKIAHSNHRESLFYKEARKHKTELLDGQDENDCSQKVLKLQEELVSFPEYNLLSPRVSPGRNKELSTSLQITSSPSRQFTKRIPIEQSNPLSQSVHKDINRQASEAVDLYQVLLDELNPKGSVNILESSDIKPLEEHDFSVLNEPVAICEGRKERSCAHSKLGKSDDKLQFVISSLSISAGLLHLEGLENPADILGKPERPSPVSVLEPFITEDITSPESTTDVHEDFLVQSQQDEFRWHENSASVLPSSASDGQFEFGQNQTLGFDKDEDGNRFVTTFLESSGISRYEDLVRWNSSDQMFNPLLFEEVISISDCPLADEPKLLFDCINEVLMEAQVGLFDCNPWSSLRRGGDLIEGVCKRLDRHLRLSELTLDQITIKDMEGSNWVDLHSETKAIVLEMGDAILEEIIEEVTMLFIL